VASAAVILCAASLASAQATQTKASPPPPEPWLQRLARFIGVSTKSPLKMRGNNVDEPGYVWSGPVGGNAVRVTAAAEYRWPVFQADGRALFALHGEMLESLSLRSGAATAIGRFPSVVKLVGVDVDAAGELLVVTRTAAGGPSRAAVLSVATKQLSVVEDADPEFVEALLGQERTYGSTAIYVQKAREASFNGPVDIENVFIRRPGADPVRITPCRQSLCTQPSLSRDGATFAYVEVPQ
jgi:hypothetical protein